MEEGRRKIRICLMSMILAAVVIGIFYYYYNILYFLSLFSFACIYIISGLTILY